MIQNLFEEYRFFPRYPEKQLKIAAGLFGMVYFVVCSVFLMLYGVDFYNLLVELNPPNFCGLGMNFLCNNLEWMVCLELQSIDCRNSKLLVVVVSNGIMEFILYLSCQLWLAQPVDIN